MPKLDRDRSIAVGAFFLLLLVLVITPILFLKARSDASQELDDQQKMLERLEAAHERAAKKVGASTQNTAAPATAFLSSQTSGLASAQLETYLSKLALAQQGSLISSAVQQNTKGDSPDVVRIQATLDISYNELQPLLYKLETGTPYVFVDSMMLQPPNSSAQRGARDVAMKVTLNLRALWRHDTGL